MCSTLAPFLHDCGRFLVHQIPILFSKTYSLAKIVNPLRGYRFYGCSLLLVYDGDNEIQYLVISLTCEQPSSRKQWEYRWRGENHRKYRSDSSPGGNPSTSTPKVRQPSDAGSEKLDQNSSPSSPYPTPLR